MLLIKLYQTQLGNEGIAEGLEIESQQRIKLYFLIVQIIEEG